MVSKGFPDVMTSGRQYNIGEKPSVILYTYINLHAGKPSVILYTYINLHAELSKVSYTEQLRDQQALVFFASPSPPFFTFQALFRSFFAFFVVHYLY